MVHKYWSNSPIVVCYWSIYWIIKYRNQCNSFKRDCELTCSYIQMRNSLALFSKIYNDLAESWSQYFTKIIHYSQDLQTRKIGCSSKPQSGIHCMVAVIHHFGTASSDDASRQTRPNVRITVIWLMRMYTTYIGSKSFNTLNGMEHGGFAVYSYKQMLIYCQLLLTTQK